MTRNLSSTPLALVPLFDMDYALTPFTDFGMLPTGRRLYAATTGGTFSGDRAEGTVLPGGSDWILAGGDGAFRLDADVTLEAGGGALIHAHWTGLLVADARTRAVFGDPAKRSLIDPRTYRYRVSATFESGASGFEWINQVVAVGAATFTETGLRYRFYSVN